MGPFPNFKRKFDFVLNFVLSKTIKKIFFFLKLLLHGYGKTFERKIFLPVQPF